LADIGLRKKVEKQVDEREKSKDKLEELFYEKPENKGIMSNIPSTNDSVFDFNEALNPDLSLKDIMADILTEKKEDVVVYNENLRKIEESKRQTDIELLESGFLKPRKPMKVEYKETKTIDPIQKKPTFERRFLSIQNIVKDSNKK